MQTKTCRQCHSDFIITDDDLKFYEKISPEFAGKKYHISSPTLCPDCRSQLRMAFRNGVKVYKRKCDLTGEEFVSEYPPNSPYKIYCPKAWHGDQWDPLKFGREFDFKQTFFEQYQKLLKEVPIMGASVVGDSINSDYTTCSGNLKDCYLMIVANDNENCLYGNNVTFSKNCVDCYYIIRCDSCYELSESYDCYRCYFSDAIKNCSECYLMHDSQGCSNCFGCVNLHDKQYYIFNQLASKDQFEYIVNEYLFGDETVKRKILDQFQQICLNQPRRFARIYNSENSSGDHINNCQNVISSFKIDDSENVKYSANVAISKDIHDVIFFGKNLERSYFSTGTGMNAQNIFFSSRVYNYCNNVFYSMYCINGAAELFGCISLKKKQYCILNKQYTKDEYEQLVPKIIKHMQKTGEWGEFFPYQLSTYAYNESLANLYYPLTNIGAEKLGSRWQYEDFSQKYEGSIYISFNDIRKYNPKFNSNAQEEIKKCLAGILKCKVSGKPFKITSQELYFYLEHNLPIPNKHFDIRREERMQKLNPWKLWQRQCVCQDPTHSHPNQCPVKFETTYAPDRPEKVYCEECYQKSII